MSLAVAYIPSKDKSERNENEYYPTPPIATLSLLKNHPVPKNIWECAAGRGHIAKELTRNGHSVISTDLYPYIDPFVNVETGVDFLKAERKNVDGIITNPPFRSNLPEKLIKRALVEHGYDFLALFCRLTFMESARRYDVFKEYPPTKVLIFSERIQCNERYFDIKDGIGGMVAYAWFVWDRSYSTTNEIQWMKPSNYREFL